jgi:hypothetical protein
MGWALDILMTIFSTPATLIGRASSATVSPMQAFGSSEKVSIKKRLFGGREYQRKAFVLEVDADRLLLSLSGRMRIDFLKALNGDRDSLALEVDRSKEGFIIAESHVCLLVWWLGAGL